MKYMIIWGTSDTYSNQLNRKPAQITKNYKSKKNYIKIIVDYN